CDAGSELKIMIELCWTYQNYRWIQDRDLTKPRRMSNHRVASIESHHSSSGRIQFQHASSIEGEERPPINREIERRTRYQGADSIHTKEPRAYFSEDSKLVKALANLHSELGLDGIAVGSKNELFLREEVNLRLCRYGPVKVVSDPAADSSLRVVE
ncbi:MAG TPA: hypothetical protein VGD41_09590, partial [Pyrinomonadaceae bacterium]